MSPSKEKEVSGEESVAREVAGGGVNVSIERASDHDKDILKYFIWAMLEEIKDFDHDVLPSEEAAEFFASICRDHPISLIAFGDGVPIGASAGFEEVLPFPVKHTAINLCGIYLDPEWRGAPAYLLSRTARKVFDAGPWSRIVTSISEHNKASIGLAKQMGFRAYPRFYTLTKDK